MRERAVRMVLKAALTAVLLLGLPLLVLGPAMVWNSAEGELQRSALSLVKLSSRLVSGNAETRMAMMKAWTFNATGESVWVELKTPSGPVYSAGARPDWPFLAASQIGDNGAQVTLRTSAWPVLWHCAITVVLILAGVVAALFVARIIAQREAREISSPLIYLAAQAQQVGSGQVRARLRPSGIEEIDLVQAELERTSERMAGRLAAERQFASDASHQLRTPLTALSMRLEEIEMIAPTEEVRTEAAICLEQVERLVGVVSDLLQRSRNSAGGTAQAVNLQDIFDQQKVEWSGQFSLQDRQLIFIDEAARLALATPGTLAQAVATLIENSLKYGSGTTLVKTRPGATKRSVVVEVSDEGPGISDDLAPQVFEKGISGFGSSGIGLPLARELVQADGGRLELVQRRPPVFSISLAALPMEVDPDRVIPQGALISVGRRRRRF